MIGQNESCGAKPVSTSYFTCLLYILEGWTGIEYLEEYLSYVVYLTWLFTPLLVAFILPTITFLLLYISVIILHIYKRRTDLKEAYLNDFWDGARQMVSTVWYVHGRIWNGYELHGLEKIPDGPALIVFYHGATPLDFYYLLAVTLLRKKRIFHVVADHFVFSLPGFKLLLDVFGVLRGSKEECEKALKNGNLLAISPGGVREALFSNENYNLMWGNRKGFAQVAIDARVKPSFHPCAIVKSSTSVLPVKAIPQAARCAMPCETVCAIHYIRTVDLKQYRRQQLELPKWNNANQHTTARILNDIKRTEPIIPMFTQNIRENIRTLGGLKIFRWIYEYFRLPIVPMYGNFPVKLRTYIGDPIPYEPNTTAEELAKKAKTALQCLINKHQKVPGNVFRAIMERFETNKKED